MGPRRAWATASLALLCAATGACTDLGAVDRRHQRLCREQAGIIVHDAALWRRYRDGARAVYLARKAEWPETKESVLEQVVGFEERFGRELSPMRPGTNGKLERSDIVLLRRGVRVAAVVDIIGSYPAFGHTEVFTCLKYPELYRRAPPAGGATGRRAR